MQHREFRFSERLMTPWAPILVGALVRLLVLPWTENLWGDAPVRTEIARDWAANPGLWWSFRDVFQFGPLPIHLGGIAIWLGLGTDAGPRIVALVCGLVGIAFCMRIARRLNGPDAAVIAGYVLALNPLHIQASTTFLSEGIYSAIVLFCIERTMAGSLIPAALAAAAAGVTRFDSWLWMPFWSAYVLWHDRQGKARAALAIFVAASGPLSILIANQVSLGDAMRPLAFVEHEHASLAMRDQASIGVFAWRAITLLFWPGSLILALTPLPALVLARGISWRAPLARWLPAIPALVPPLLYCAKTLMFGAFWPMPRLINPTSALLSTYFVQLSTRQFRGVLGTAVAFNLVLVVVTLSPGQVGEAVCRVSPVVRLPPDLRAGVEAWKANPTATLIDEVSTWEDIAIAYHAGQNRAVSRQRARAEGVRRIIAIRGGKLEKELRLSGVVEGAQFTLVGENGRISWWDAAERARSSVDAGPRVGHHE